MSPPGWTQNVGVSGIGIGGRSQGGTMTLNAVANGVAPNSPIFNNFQEKLSLNDTSHQFNSDSQQTLHTHHDNSFKSESIQSSSNGLVEMEDDNSLDDLKLIDFDLDFGGASQILINSVIDETQEEDNQQQQSDPINRTNATATDPSATSIANMPSSSSYGLINGEHIKNFQVKIEDNTESEQCNMNSNVLSIANDRGSHQHCQAFGNSHMTIDIKEEVGSYDSNDMSNLQQQQSLCSQENQFISTNVNNELPQRQQTQRIKVSDFSTLSNITDYISRVLSIFTHLTVFDIAGSKGYIKIFPFLSACSIILVNTSLHTPRSRHS